MHRSMVNLLRIWGREPLRSATRLLRSTNDLCLWNPSHRLVAGSRDGPRRLRDLARLVVPGSQTCVLRTG
jgi:hypothetical protein